MALNVIHLVALILGVLVLVSAVCAVSGVNQGWLKNSQGGEDLKLGTLKVHATIAVSGVAVSETVTWSDFISFIDYASGTTLCKNMDKIGKAVLALSVIAMFTSLVGVVCVAVRAFDLAPIKVLSVVAGVVFILAAVTIGVSWMTYIGGFLGTCCKDGASCSVDGDYAFAFAIIGMVLAIPAAVLSFVGASKEAPSA